MRDMASASGAARRLCTNAAIAAFVAAIAPQRCDAVIKIFTVMLTVFYICQLSRGPDPLQGMEEPSTEQLLRGRTYTFEAPAASVNADDEESSKSFFEERPKLKTALIWGFSLLTIALVGTVVAIFIPRAPVMTLTESVRVNITLIPFSIETEDHWVVANRNFFPVTLEVYQYAVYYESVLIGEGVELEQPPFPAKSDSLFVSHKVMTTNTSAPVLQSMIEDCQQHQSLLLTVRADSTWIILASTKRTRSYVDLTYPCKIAY